MLRSVPRQKVKLGQFQNRILQSTTFLCINRQGVIVRREHQAVGMTAILRTQLLLSASSNCCCEEGPSSSPASWTLWAARSTGTLTHDESFDLTLLHDAAVAVVPARKCLLGSCSRAKGGMVPNAQETFVELAGVGKVSGVPGRHQPSQGCTSARPGRTEAARAAVVRGRAALLCWHCTRLQLPQQCCNGRMDRPQAVCSMHWVKCVV